MTTRKIKYFTKPELMQAVKAGNKRGYNRQLDYDRVVSEVPGQRDDGTQWKFPIVFSMLHEHINGEEVEPHMRVMVALDENNDRVLFDISMERFNNLTEVEIDVPDKEDA